MNKDLRTGALFVQTEVTFGWFSLTTTFLRYGRDGKESTVIIVYHAEKLDFGAQDY